MFLNHIFIYEVSISNRLGVRLFWKICPKGITSWLRETIWEKNQFLFVFFQSDPELRAPPPLCFFTPFTNLKKKKKIIWTKVPQSVWILVILPNIHWKMSKPKQKKFLFLFGMRQRSPLSSSFWESGEKCPNTNDNKKSSSKRVDLDKTPPPPLFWKKTNRNKSFFGGPALMK